MTSISAQPTEDRGAVLEAARAADRAWREERAVELQARIDRAHWFQQAGMRVWQWGWIVVAGAILVYVASEIAGSPRLAVCAVYAVIGLAMGACGSLMQRLGAVRRRRLLERGDREQLLVWDPARVLHPGDSP